MACADEDEEKVVKPLIIYQAVVKPRNLTFTLDHASVFGFNLTSGGGLHLTSFFNMVIRAHNPNHRKKLQYRSIRVSIFKNKQKLAEDSVPGFTQHNGSLTLLRAEPVALNVSLKKSPAFELGIESGKGYVDFDVFMTAALVGNHLRINCPNVVVNLTENSAVGFQTSGCKVGVYW